MPGTGEDSEIATMDALLHETMELVRQEQRQDNLCDKIVEMNNIWRAFVQRLLELETRKVREEIQLHPRLE
jgi:uncharacterized membrane protein YjjP (DUF1212 family)